MIELLFQLRCQVTLNALKTSYIEHVVLSRQNTCMHSVDSNSLLLKLKVFRGSPRLYVPLDEVVDSHVR